MQNLFSLMPEVHLGTFKVPQWLYVREGLQRNVAAVQAYARQNPTAVRAQHFLVRLLGAIDVSHAHNLERYYDIVDSRALNVAMALKMTSPIYPGQVFEGEFYGWGNREILIAHNTDFDPYEAHQNWQSLAPIQVLRHPLSDLGLPILDGVKNFGSEKGLVVLLINIPLLAVQYRAFSQDDDRYNQDLPGSMRTVEQFLRMYVLPNMLASHLDLAIFNRISCLQAHQPVGHSTYRHPFFLPDYSHRCDQVLQEVLDKLYLGSQMLPGILRSVPAVTLENMDEVMRVPQVVQTRQVLWALITARTNALSFMFKASRLGAAITNGQEVQRLRRAALSWKSDKILRSALPIDLFWQVQREIDGILQEA